MSYRANRVKDENNTVHWYRTDSNQKLCQSQLKLTAQQGANLSSFW